MLRPPGDPSALTGSVLIGADSGVVLSAPRGGELIKNAELGQSRSYLRSGSPASRKQLPACEFLSALLRGQIGVGGRCEWMHAITPGFSQDWTQVSSHSERGGTQQRCLPVQRVTQDLPLFLPALILPRQSGQNPPTMGQICLYFHAIWCFAGGSSVVGVHSFVPEPMGSPDTHSGQPASL